MKLKKYLIQKIVNNIVWPYFKGSNRFKIFRELDRVQWNSLDKNRNLQKGKLYKLIRYADENIPYYHQTIKTKHIDYTKETIFEDIKKFPVLTKKIIRENYDRLINRDISHWYIANYSAGTTGEPLRLLQDQVMHDYSDAVTVLFNKWAGREEGEPMVDLWGSLRDILQGSKGLKKWLIQNFMTNHYALNTFKMSEKDIRNYIRFINRKKPYLIQAYVQSIYEIAQFIRDERLKVYSPKGIITAAGTLYPTPKEYIEKIFGCPVFNRYGTREVGVIACDCEKHEGLHLNIFSQYFEILDENLNEAKVEGALGEVYITQLDNYVMPLIRYKLNDIATYTGHICSCGRGMPLIKTVNGRDTDLLVNTKGEKIDGLYFDLIFYFRDYIRRFQVIQEARDKLLIKLLPMKKQEKNNFLNIYKKEIKDLGGKIELVMGENCKIEYKIVDEIEMEKSGKFRYTISKIKD